MENFYINQQMFLFVKNWGEKERELAARVIHKQVIRYVKPDVEFQEIVQCVILALLEKTRKTGDEFNPFHLRLFVKKTLSNCYGNARLSNKVNDILNSKYRQYKIQIDLPSLHEDKYTNMIKFVVEKIILELSFIEYHIFDMHFNQEFTLKEAAQSIGIDFATANNAKIRIKKLFFKEFDYKKAKKR